VGWMGTELATLVLDHWDNPIPGQGPKVILPEPELAPECPSSHSHVEAEEDESVEPAGIGLWTSDHVASWLEDIGLGHAKAQFSGQAVGGDTLRQISLWKISNLELSMKLASQELGLTKLGDVGKFFAELDKL